VVVALGVLGAILSLTKSNDRRHSTSTISPGESVAPSTPAVADFERLTLDGQLEALQRADPQEKHRLAPIFRERFNRDIGKVPVEDQELFFRKMAAAGLSDINRVEPSPAQGAQTPPVEAETPSRLPQSISSPTPNPSRLVSALPLEPTMPPPKAIDPCRATPTRRPVRPPNGYEFAYDHGVKGNGKLTVNNGNSDDAAVMIASPDPDTPDRLFYIRAGMEATMAEILPGRYQIKFQVGRIWEPESCKCVLATAIFEREESFEEQRIETDAGTELQYAHIHLTLHEVLGGNARTTPISPNAFRRRK
jgi:hypothetical protein